MKNATSRIGETAVATNGFKMTVIAYRSCRDVDIQFENGTVVANKTYGNFRKGLIAHPDVPNKQTHMGRIGETVIANNGMKMTIIAYRSATDLDVQFEDGTITYNKGYKEFKKGTIANSSFYELRKQKKENRLHQKTTTKFGEKIEIVEYKNTGDLTVAFFDGTIKKADYKSFLKGTIVKPQNHIGEISVAHNGLKMTVIAYRNNKEVDVQFETGEIRTNVAYEKFLKGNIALVKLCNDKAARIDEIVIANNGLKMTIIAYKTRNNMDVRFETGEIRTGVSYDAFLEKTVKSNMHCNDIKIERVAYEYNGTNNFYCHCEKCGKPDIMTVEEMKQHKCEVTPLLTN